MNFKKRKEKDRAFTSIFRSFLEKLNKSKEYIPVEDLTQVNNPDQTFKVFEEEVFDKKVYTLEDTSDILSSLSEKKSFKLEQVSRITKKYNLHIQSKLSEVIRISVPIRCHWKKKQNQLSEIPLGLSLIQYISLPSLPLPPILPVILMNWLPTPDGNGYQIIINMLA